MRAAGLAARMRRRFRIEAGDQPLYHPNVLQRQFTSAAPNQKWVADATFIRTKSNWVFLAVVIDLYSRKVVGWAMGPNLNHKLTSSALQMAITKRNPQCALLHHSDQGVAYTASAYQDILTDNRITSSMSRPGNCWDNAVVESFFSTLKKELVRNQTFSSIAHAHSEIGSYIEGWYNKSRLHSSIGYLSPAERESIS